MARIDADKELELERMRQEREDRKEAEERSKVCRARNGKEAKAQSIQQPAARKNASLQIPKWRLFVDENEDAIRDKLEQDE